MDLDWTVRRTLSGEVQPLWPSDQELLPGVLDKLWDMKGRGYLVIGVTNQGGVAFGYLTEETVRAVNRRLDEMTHGVFDAIYYDPHHPMGTIPAYRRVCPDRKPGPGMALRAAREFQTDLAASIMVGDLPTDEQFARNAGIGSFFWANEFFGHGRSRNGT